MMKRMFAALLAMLMLCAGALAEETGLTFEVYAQSFAELTEAVWEADGAQSLQTLSPDESVTVSACLAEERVAAVTVEYPCGAATDMVRAALENLGWLSAESLDAVLALEEGATAELDGCSVWRVHGKNRDAFSICSASDAEGMLWQPVHGGERIHDTPRCSGMDVSRMITEAAAAQTGWESCGICMKAAAE